MREHPVEDGGQAPASRAGKRCRELLSSQSAFTLIELLVVIAIIAILAALLFRRLRQPNGRVSRSPASPICDNGVWL